MSKIRCYFPNVLLTFLLVFLLLGCGLTAFVRTQVLNAETFSVVTAQEGLADKAYSSLETYFKTRANSTGIPAEVFTDVMDRDELEKAINASVGQAFDYLSGKTAEFGFTMDFTALEQSVQTFFSSYAEENNVVKDKVYEEKVASVIAEAEAEILFVADTFKLTMMYEKGWLGTARHYLTYLGMAQTACLIGLAVVLVLLLLCNLRQISHMLYWCGTAGLTASLLLLAPCIYVTATDYFAGFAIKDPQIFAAVVGFLELLVSRAQTMAIIVLAVSIGCLAVFGIVRAVCGRKGNDAEEAPEEASQKVTEQDSDTEKKSETEKESETKKA